MSFGAGNRIAYDQSGVILMGGSNHDFVNVLSIQSIVRSSNYTTVTTTTPHGVTEAGDGVVISGTSGFDGTFQISGRTTYTLTYPDAGSNATGGVAGNVTINTSQPKYLTTVTGGSGFGYSVAVGNGRIVVGDSTGTVYVYDLDGNLTNSLSSAGGYKVAIGSGIIACSNGTSAVKFYKVDGTYIGQITGSGSFGADVSISADRVAIANPSTKTVSVYDFAGNKKFDLTETTTGFASGVSAYRNRFFVISNSYLYGYNEFGQHIDAYPRMWPTTFSTANKIATDGYNFVVGGSNIAYGGRFGGNGGIRIDGAASYSGSALGSSVAMGSNLAVFGDSSAQRVDLFFSVSYDDINGENPTASVYPHDSSGSYGRSVAVNGSRLAVGASGKVYIYKIPTAFNVYESAAYVAGER
jgi:hypothetical protein